MPEEKATLDNSIGKLRVERGCVRSANSSGIVTAAPGGSLPEQSNFRACSG